MTITLTEKQIKERFKEWAESHCITTHFPNLAGEVDLTDDRFHYAQNAVGDILGWPQFWSKFIKELTEKDLSKNR